VAVRTEDVVNRTATEERRAEAADKVGPVYADIGGVEEDVKDTIEQVIQVVRDGVEPIGSIPGTSLPATTAPSTTEGTATTEPPGTVEVTGSLFLDFDSNALLEETPLTGIWADAPLAGVPVTIFSGDEEVQTETGPDGRFTATITEGLVGVRVDSPDVPAKFVISTLDQAASEICSASDAPCELRAVGFKPNVRSIDAQVTDLETRFGLLERRTLDTLARIATDDVVRQALEQDLGLTEILKSTLTRVTDEFKDGILQEELDDKRNSILASPPLVLLNDAVSNDAGDGAADMAATYLSPNRLVNQEAWDQGKKDARDAVAPVTERFVEGRTIAGPGTVLTQLHIDAINATRAASGRAQHALGLLAVIATLGGSVGFYMARFRPKFWARPRMLALLGVLMVLAAGSVRLTIRIQEAVDDVSAWYALPAVAIGLMTTVLFDARMAVLMSLTISVLAAAATRDPGVAVFGLLATLTPIGFVSSLSNRGAFRKAVVYSSVVVAAIAASTSWFFHTEPDQSPLSTVGLAAGWAFATSIVAALVGLALLQFFDTAFDVTTNLRLLELTDRNHQALVLLQEEAFGTFNHSLMVGTLADAAARSVGANPLLARAAAYFHDLGKTANPTMFIENQFGIPNPHDEMAPLASVEVVRRHVTDGIELARKFRIPTEVAEGILTHHGDGVIRFFYEKARRLEGDDQVDPNDFRHVGHKPRTAEMAIVMLADSLEAACRAVFQEEPPTPESIEKVVMRVINEKVDDGQLSESSLTLGQLTRVRRAFLDSLVGHYHQRIAYPNFPGG
jgi:putative nucleotidyltransferase with HDIG domain